MGQAYLTERDQVFDEHGLQVGRQERPLPGSRRSVSVDKRSLEVLLRECPLSAFVTIQALSLNDRVQPDAVGRHGQV
jgi:hypothetical protein